MCGNTSQFPQSTQNLVIYSRIRPSRRFNIQIRRLKRVGRGRRRTVKEMEMAGLKAEIERKNMKLYKENQSIIEENEKLRKKAHLLHQENQALLSKLHSKFPNPLNHTSKSIN